MQIQQDLELPTTEIATRIAPIQQALEDTAAKFSDFYNAQATSCNSGKSQMSDFIGKLQNDKVAIGAEENKYHTEFESRGAALESEQSSLRAYQAELHEIEEEIKKEIENLRIYGIEAEEKLVLLKYLRDIIIDELMKEPAAQSFIQLKVFNDKMRQLKVLLEKSHDSKYAPLVTSLLTVLETRGFSDQGILQNILNVLSKLQENLLAFREKQESNGKQNIENIKERGKNKVIDIKQTAHHIAESRSIVANAEHQIRRLGKEQELLDHEIQRKNHELSFWSELCHYADELNVKAEKWRSEIGSSVSEATSAVFGH